MKDYLAQQVRNICMLGHSGSGKTSVVEAMLFTTGAIERMGKATDGNSALDYDSEEIKRGLSVFTSLAPVEWKNAKINFIDTPGYLDYVGEQEAGIAVADNALIVVSGKEGVESGTEKAWKRVKEKEIPTIFFINKIDEENASFDKTYEQLRETFGKSVIPFEMPIYENNEVVGSVNILKKKAWYHNNKTEAQPVPKELEDSVAEYWEQIAEAVAMSDDALMEKFFEGEAFSEAEILKGVRIGVRSGEICPVYCGSAINQTGIIRLMDLIIEYFPSYAEKGVIKAKTMEDDVVELKTNEDEDFTAQVFKTIIDPFVGRISFIKIMSGVLSSDASIINVQKEKAEKINQIYSIQGKHQVGVGKLFTGDIGALVKLQYTDTNDTLATKNKLVVFEPIKFPEPMLGVALWPKTKNDEDKMSTALHKMEEEDPSIRVVKNAETNELILYGMGDQHIDVVVSKLKSKYKVDLDLTDPKIPYRETITATVTAEGKHKKQSGGAGQFGHVYITFEPSDSEDMVFEEKIFGGAVPKQYFPAVEAGLRESMNKGVLAGFKVVGVKASLVDGKYHDVDSKEIAFKSAARLAYKAGMPKAKPMLLEPIVKVDVLVPEEYTGTVIGDLNKRRGIILGMELVSEKEQVVNAEVPMAEMMRYTSELRSFTQGKGSFSMEFNRYEICPQQIADKVIASHKRDLEEEE